MYIKLSKEDLKKILTDRFGEATFEVSYFESNDLWQKRTGRRLSDFKSQDEMDKVSPMQNFIFFL